MSKIHNIVQNAGAKSSKLLILNMSFHKHKRVKLLANDVTQKTLMLGLSHAPALLQNYCITANTSKVNLI